MSYTVHNNNAISFYRLFIQSVLIYLLNLTAQWPSVEDADMLYEQVLANRSTKRHPDSKRKNIFKKYS